MSAETETQIQERETRAMAKFLSKALSLWRFLPITVRYAVLGLAGVSVGGGGNSIIEKFGSRYRKMDSLLVAIDQRTTRTERKVDTSLFKTRECVGAIERIPGGKAALKGYRKERDEFRHRQDIYGAEAPNGAIVEPQAGPPFAAQPQNQNQSQN